MSVDVMLYLILYTAVGPLIFLPIIWYMVKKKARKRGESRFSTKAMEELTLWFIVISFLHLAFLHLIKFIFPNEFKQTQLYILNAFGLQ